MDTAALEEMLLRGSFSARLAGQVEADIGGD